MYMYTVGHSRICSTGVYLPTARLKSNDILREINSLERFGVPHDWLERAMGITERRVAPDGMMPSEMASLAAKEALERANVGAEEIDAIIYAGVDRDFMLEPATAHVVQAKIEAHNAVAFDVTNACHGFMNGLHLMDALIATGQVRRGLVVSGEQGSRYIEKAMHALSTGDQYEEFSKLVGGLTLGDAGAALIMGPKVDPDTGFMGFMLQSQGQHWKLCTCGKRGEESALETDMSGIVEKGIDMLGRMYNDFMNKLGWEASEIDKFVHHQVGLKVFRRHARYAGIDVAIMPNTISKLGNLVTANIPVNLHLLSVNQQVKVGEKVFIAGAGSGLAVSQAGLVWNAA